MQSFKSITSRWDHQNTIKVEWNLGKRCNLDCTYCPSSIHDNFSPHTNIKILCDTVDALVELEKPIRLSLTGGEPTVHPDFEELLEHIRLRGINWLNVTTNGTRTADWYLRNEMWWNHLNFSLHFEKDWERVFSTINVYHDTTDRDYFVNIMAHHDYMEEVKSVVAHCQKVGIKYAVRRIRWTEGDHDIFDDMRYDGKDLEWLLSQDATAEPNCVDEHGQLYHPNDIIKHHKNNFKGWTCNVGLESLMINWDGEVHRATCRVGGSLGNIYDGSFEAPDAPVVCDRNWCTCAADIPITKSSD
jgi:MoaA/NifB/PqqE/SkfB family radical SAM enzyme